MGDSSLERSAVSRLACSKDKPVIGMQIEFKSETRNSKFETNSNFRNTAMFKTRRPRGFSTFFSFGFRVCFGFRISGFGFQLQHLATLLQRGSVLLLCTFSVVVFPSRGANPSCSNATTVVVVIGAAGEAEYGSNFLHQASLWEKACAQAGSKCLIIGRDSEPATNDYTTLKETLAAQNKDSSDQLWLVLIGHGAFDGKEARFNLRGPDVSASDLALWLQPFRRPLAIIDTASSSAPFLNKLSATNRVIITATRSGYEQNYARFGSYFAELLLDPAADLDKDRQVSLLEAFLVASRRTMEFYKGEGRLVTEHALLDDNGDGLGTPAEWFQGLRAVKKAKDKGDVDGLLARYFCLVPNDAERRLTSEQRARRDTLERQVLLYREKKASVAEDEYYQELERLLLQLARFTASNSPASN